MYRILTFALLLIINSKICYGGSFNWEWAVSAQQSNAISGGTTIARDNFGNIYLAGTFKGSITYGPTTLTSSGNEDIFVAKLDASGNPLWVKRFGGTGTDKVNGYVTYAKDNLYITGEFSDTAYFGSFKLGSKAGTRDIFFVKLDTAGNVIIAKSAGGDRPDKGTNIAVDVWGCIYVTGMYGADGSSPPPPTTATFDTATLTSKGGDDAFLAKYSPTGNLMWAKTIGGMEGDIGYGIAADSSGNVYVSGSYDNPYVYFDTLRINSNSSGFTLGNMFIAKYDSGGRFKWAKTLGGRSGNTNAGAISGGVVLSAPNGGCYFNGLMYNCQLVAGTNQLSGRGDFDPFLGKLDSAGNFIWVKTMGSTSYDDCSQIVADGQGYIYMSGSISGPASFGSQSAGSKGGEDAYIAKFDGEGTARWVTTIGGTGNDYGASLVIDPSRNIFLSGYFGSSPCEFGALTLNNSTSSDAFVAKLSTPTGIVPVSTGGSVRILPNPTCGTFQVASPQTFRSLSVVDGLGRKVLEQHYQNPSTTVVVELPANLADGIYYLLLGSSEETFSGKLLLQR